MLHRIVIILILIGTAYSGTIMQPNDKENKEKQQQLVMQQQSNTVSTPVQDRYVSSYVYSTYPTYSTYPQYDEKLLNGKYKVKGQIYIDSTIAPTQNSELSHRSFISNLMPFLNNLIIYSGHILRLGLLVLLGGVFTTLICTFTPICNITFPGLGISKNQVQEQIAELARNYVSLETLNAVTTLISNAVDKYTSMQHENGKEIK